LGVLRDEVEALAEGADELDEILADEAHHLIDGVSWNESGGFREAAEEGDVDRRVQLREGVAVHAQPLGGDIRAAGIKPLGGFEPVAEATSILVDAEVLENEAQRADGRVIGGKLVVIEVVLRGIVLAADIDHGGGGVSEVFRGGFAADDFHAVDSHEEAAGEELVLMRAAGMSEDAFDGHGGGKGGGP
jgi:hypothetical protein